MPRPIPNLRWWIAGLLALSIGLNYLDRQTLSVLASTIQKDLGLSTVAYSRVTFAFLFSYSIMYAIGGRLIDVLGTRKGLLIFATAWSIATALHGLAAGFWSLVAFRVLLGLTEAANIPAGVKGVAEWFPVRERALAVGIFNAGTAAGATLAVPVVSFIALGAGWRWAFVATGAVGFVWVALWAMAYRLPRDHARLGDDERRLILGDGDAAGGRAAEVRPPVPVRRLLAMPETWGCIAARVLTDPISYFLNFWIPKYLQDERHFALAEIGKYVWIPFVALAFGNLAAGAIPRFLISRGLDLNRARKMTMLAVSLVMPVLCFLITQVESPALAIAVIAALFFGHGAWGNVILPAEVFPARVVGTVTGLGGMFGGFASAFTQLGIGKVVAALSFKPVFAVSAGMYLVAFALVAILVRDLGRIRDLDRDAAGPVAPGAGR